MATLRSVPITVIALALVSCDVSSPAAPDIPALSADEAVLSHGRNGEAVRLPFELEGAGGPADPSELNIPQALDCDLDGGFIPRGNEATGTATHLGRFRSEHQQCVNFATFEFEDGFVVYHAANGDDLWASFGDGQLTWVAPAILGYDDQPVVVVGGTGRFDGATGLLSGGGRIDVRDGSFTFWARGYVNLLRP